MTTTTIVFKKFLENRALKQKVFNWGSGGDSFDRAVASDARGLQRSAKFLLNIVYCQLY